MKKLIICVFFSLVVLGALFFIPLNNKDALISPARGLAKIRLADNLWFPGKLLYSSLKPPILTAKAGFAVETGSGDVLFEQNIHEKMPIASLAKIMTAIITLESKKFTDNISVSQRAADMEPDKMFLIAGETLTVEELLQGVFLVSANDGAEALAEKVTGDREEFISLMNLKARQLGMKNTLFINSTGLQEDGKEQYSSAFDVALMSRFAIKQWPELVEISGREHIQIPRTLTHQDYDLYSGINLLTSYPGVVGFKTGFTPEAGLTLVTLARKEGKEVLGVILGATDRRNDAKELLDYSFKKLNMNQ